MRCLLLLLKDRRAAAVIEFAIILPTLITLMMPLTDIVIAIARYINAYQRLSEVGAFLQYNPPADITSPDSTWTSGIQTMLSKYGVSSGTVQIVCGATATICSSSNMAEPRTFVLSGNITISSSFPVFVPGLAGTYTVTYKEGF